MSTILVVDDDDRLRDSFRRLLSGEGYQVELAESGEAALVAVGHRLPDLVIMDVRMPGLSGLETFRALKEIDSKLPVIIMTAYGTTDTAIEATKLGAFDYVLKPFDIPGILNLIKKAMEAGRLMHAQVEIDVQPDSLAPEALIGKSEPMQEVYKAIGRVAPTDATVLVRGESGTGKELVARALYQHSLRARRPFMVINCVAIPETLLESELFGYEKGAFTGAAARRLGKIEQAQGGTVFLDEIGDMPLGIQGKILRLLQERKIERLGGRDPISVDVRILAATNRDLELYIEQGRFREDLYYRLNVVSILLPPLRERPGDQLLLSDYFLGRFAKEMGIDKPKLTEEAQTLLAGHPWPGNVRELANAVKKALIFRRGYPIRPEDITHGLRPETSVETGKDEDADEAMRKWIRATLLAGTSPSPFAHFLDHLTCLVLEETLEITKGNRTRAAKLLGISRPTLHDKMGQCGMPKRGSENDG